MNVIKAFGINIINNNKLMFSIKQNEILIYKNMLIDNQEDY